MKEFLPITDQPIQEESLCRLYRLYKNYSPKDQLPYTQHQLIHYFSDKQLLNGCLPYILPVIEKGGDLFNAEKREQVNKDLRDQLAQLNFADKNRSSINSILVAIKALPLDQSYLT